MRAGLMVFVVVLLFGACGMAYSDSTEGESHGRSVEEVLEEIRQAQGLDPGDRIDPSLVSEHMLEELGEAVMSLMHPDPRDHETMDEMMGGEGSESLAAMHRAMGYRYLSGYGGSRAPWGRMGPGSGGMMMGGMMGAMMGPGNDWNYWEREERARRFWGTALPWALTGVLSVAVAALSVVIATQ
jgi:hypothetical protein